MSSNKGDWGWNPVYTKNQLEFYSDDKSNYHRVDALDLNSTVCIQNNNNVHMYVDKVLFINVEQDMQL